MSENSLKIAVTGGVASGKSTVCNIFEDLGVATYSADQFSRDVVKKDSRAYHKIIEHFGKTVVKEDGSINRRLLRDIITKNHQEKVALENIVHPEIISLMKKKLAETQKKSQIIVMEVPLLFELGLENLFDVTIMVYAESDLKMKRLQARDNVTEEKASTLIGLQMADKKKVNCSDFVIFNNGSQEQLAKEVKKLYRKILET